MSDIYSKVLEALVREFSGVGAIGGVSTPLGTGPKAGSGPGNIYKSSQATDKKHRSKGKSKKTYTRSVQWYLKNGGEKGRKRSLKEIYGIISRDLLLERTDRLYDLSPQDVLNFLSHLKGDILQDVSFNISEKISGQNTTVGIKGSSSGNEYYFALKSQLEKNNDIFNRRYLNGASASRKFKHHFKQNYDKIKQLSPGETNVLGVEIIKGDSSKPDYIAYGVPSRQTQAAVFMGDFTKSDAQNMTGNGIVFLSAEDIQKSPVGKEKMSQEVAGVLDDLYHKVSQSIEAGLNKKQFVQFVKQEILPDFRSNITALFGNSHLNDLSPIEGIAVNMVSGENSRFFKVHTAEFENIQQVQTSLYSEFKSNRTYDSSKPLPFSNTDFLNYQDRFGNFIRAGLLYDYVNDIGRQRKYRSLGFYIFNFIRKISEMTHSQNTRVFFSPKTFKTLCQKLLNAVNNNQPEDYIDVINFLGSNIPEQTTYKKRYSGKDRHGKSQYRTQRSSEFVWHTISGGEDYNCTEANQIKNLNFDI